MPYLVVAALLVVVVLALMRAYRRSAGDEGMVRNRIGDGLRRLNLYKDKYGVMTEALLRETPDEELLEAVLSNLWAKMQPDLSDAVAVMDGLSQKRQWFYALYAVTGGIKQDGFAGTKSGREAALIPLCAQGLEEIGAARSARILTEAMDEADADEEAYLESFDAEQGKACMIRLVREDPAAFTDT